MTMTPQSAHEELLARARKQALLGSCSAVLGWDEQTYMPAGGAALRGDQMALLAGLQHEQATHPRIGELLAITAGSSLAADPQSDAAANLRELARDYKRGLKLPQALVEELARTTSLAQSEWVIARSTNDFVRFKPWLEKIFELKRQESACLRSATEGGSAYDPLLDEYEPGAQASALETLFQTLKAELVPLVQTVVERTRGSAGEAVLKRLFPRDRQRIFAEAVAAGVGFDFTRGRLDETAHPFCSGFGPGDCRITTRFDDRHFNDAFFGVLHEVGHGLYEQGLEQVHFGSPLGEAVSLGVHESQSRLWENAVGRGRPFWRYWHPLARRIFHEALGGVSLDAFLAAVNHVEPSLIRVQADEATYNLHIIIRFELERALLEGDLLVDDLPAAWSERYAALLGVVPKTDAEGCLQDIHWSAGLIGYFPTYTLGNLYAARLFRQAKLDLGDLDSSFAAGDFSPLLAWLRAKIHRHGRRHPPAQLIDQAAGPASLVESLRQKYQELFGV